LSRSIAARKRSAACSRFPSRRASSPSSFSRKAEDRLVADARQRAVDLGEQLPHLVGFAPLMLLAIQFLELHQRVTILRVEAEHFLECLVRAIDEAAAAEVEAQAEQDVRVLQRLQPRPLQQALVNIDGAADLALLAVQVAEDQVDFERVLIELRRARQLVDRQIDLVRDDQVEPDDEVGRLAGLAPIDPLSVAQLVALPPLADGKTGQQRQQARSAWDRQSCPARHLEPRRQKGFPASLGFEHQSPPVRG
jgi:hypothetical protein